MKALLDEHLSSEIAAKLRSRGLDVQAVTERPDLVRRSDEEIVEAATAEGRAVVTNNVKDFRPIATRRLTDSRGHGGLILLPATRSRTRAAADPLADGIEAIMRTNPDGIAGSERWVPPVQVASEVLAQALADEDSSPPTRFRWRTASLGQPLVDLEDKEAVQALLDEDL